MAKTVVIDRGYKKWKRNMRVLAETPLTVGILDARSVDGEEATLADIAHWLEFGTDDGDIPERPVHRQTFEELMPQLKRKYAQYAALVTAGKISPKQAQHRIGLWYAGKLRWAIIKYNDVPNAPSTIKKKGYNDPLIETGGMVNAINYKLG